MSVWGKRYVNRPLTSLRWQFRSQAAAQGLSGFTVPLEAFKAEEQELSQDTRFCWLQGIEVAFQGVNIRLMNVPFPALAS